VVDKILGDQIWIGIEVIELPKIGGYQITGSTKSEDEDLRPLLDIIGNVTPYADYTKKHIENTINEYYDEKGYRNAQVDVYARNDTARNNSLTVFIDIQKNAKVKIDKIYLNGNEEVSDRLLLKQMKDTRMRTQFNVFYNNPEDPITKENFTPKGIVGILSAISYKNVADFVSQRAQVRIFNSSKYDPVKAKADAQAIVTYYKSLGYRDAQIKLDSVYDVNDRALAISYTIEEGDVYYFRNIIWKGNTKFTAGKLDSILDISKGSVYNQSYLDQRISFDLTKPDVTSYYMDDGYLFFRINAVETYAQNDSIDLEIRIFEGPQATIDQIFIRGNTKTSEHVIRRELRTYPGQKFNRSQVIRSQREIIALGLFDQEQIAVNPIPHPESGTVDIEYTVVEKPSDQLELSAGYGGQGYGILASVGIVLNNWSTKQMFEKGAWRPYPSGDGQKVSFRINTTGRLYQAFNIGFVEPWFLGKKPNSFSVSLTRTQLGYNVPGTTFEDIEGSFAANGASVGYGIRLKWPDDYFTLLSSVNYFNYNLFNYPIFIAGNGSYNNFSIKETLARNNIDDPQFPRSGSSIALSLQFTPPYSRFNDKDYTELSEAERYKFIEYYKWRFNADYYTPVVGKLVLRTSIKFGWLGYYNSDVGIPPFERFQLGGDGLSGGFNNTFVGTDIISLRGYEIFNVQGTSTSRTEAIFNKYTLELRYPIVQSQTANIYALAFAEGGNLYPDIDAFNPFDLKRSAGLGVRAWLPMFGLLGVDYGIRFDDQIPGDLQEANGFFDYITKNGKFTVILGFEPE
jgi:outer membrane protein insertion porin family